ncbi:hypothetical protein [Acholeplasma laidlawii]|jgi:hypothetical protein|uniref:Uncharacterized protein n=2 Tax=Acholeplasma laidlawii TaxID=2148 RepID=A9NGJ7_ACHLI|nr:hypothetical protein [Acholeplasma laidlawii]ABX81477.1 hypothetical protein ACL_0864 [Acholeplasma laidlawii PG-8A]MBG0763068.1 hypothetical protein [Acholeplasma laidlawii]NWH09949.1 hypothetical protein [Acholeplasma laidlawii]NWH11339.1 hypothetical protein [Acholeplasma laidlawii]NWH13251.1 hypothetical protein [Acholeplasma laidlawii]
MAWSNETYLIGEKIRVEGERDLGIVTRLDLTRGLIYVMFKRLREEAYPYPESIENETLQPIVTQQP